MTPSTPAPGWDTALAALTGTQLIELLSALERASARFPDRTLITAASGWSLRACWAMQEEAGLAAQDVAHELRARLAWIAGEHR